MTEQRLDLISYVVRKNNIADLEYVRGLFINMLESDDEDVVYSALEHLNATEYEDSSIQNLLADVQSKLDEEDDEADIDAGDFDYVYEGESINYWLNKYLIDKDCDEVLGVVEAFEGGQTSADFMKSRNIEESSHKKELNRHIEMWVTSLGESAEEAYINLLNELNDFLF